MTLSCLSYYFHCSGIFQATSLPQLLFFPGPELLLTTHISSGDFGVIPPGHALGTLCGLGDQASALSETDAPSTSF